MTFLANISIRTKLVLMLLFPLAGLLYFSTTGVVERMRVAGEMASIQTLSRLAVKLSALVHETQKERGASALFMGSKGTRFSSELQAQRASTDRKISELRAFLGGFDGRSFGRDFEDRLARALQNLDVIGNKRNDISGLRIPASEAIAYYTTMNASFLDVIAEMSVLSDNAEIARMVSAYVNFLQGKERAGIERAVLSNTFAADRFGPNMLAKFITLVAEQNTYTRVFASFATPEQRRFLQDKLRHPSVRETERMRTVALSKAGSGGFGVDAARWFQLQTEKINLLKEVEDRISDDLVRRTVYLKDEVQSSLTFFLFLTLCAFTASVLSTYFVARAIVRPVGAMIQAADALARGDTGYDIAFEGRDEVGRLAVAFRSMGNALRAKAETAAQIARGNLSVRVEAVSAEDVLGDAMVRMVESLKAMNGEVNNLVQAAVEGNLSVRGDVSRFEGDYARIVQGINNTLDAMAVPINEATRALEKMAARDLTARMTGDYQGDFSKIKDAINTAAQNLDDGMLQVGTASEQVSSAASQISGGSQSLAEGASEQASSLEEISSSLEEMSSMIRQNAENSDQAKTLAQTARASADRGTEAMRRMTETINKIKTSSDETARIVSTIDEIAFQTNLLALNAAVEAARAGEAGKGFAVVAEEVRNLAQRSAEAARTTADMIDESVKNAGEGVNVTEEVSSILSEIAGGARKVNDLVLEIAAASGEQAQGIDQVNTGVSQLNQVTQQNAANAEESASAAEELNGQAEELQQMVNTFRLTGDRVRPAGAAMATHGLAGGGNGQRKQAHGPFRKERTDETSVRVQNGRSAQPRKPEDIIPLDDGEILEEF